MEAVSSRRLDPIVRRAQLVGVAVDLYAARPFEAVGLEDVARAAGVRRSLLYRYFPQGRADLHLAAVQEAWRRLIDAVDTDPGIPLSEKLESNVARMLARSEAGDPAFAVLADATRSSDARVRSLTREARRSWARQMARNHLGTGDVAEPVLAALSGYLAYAELVLAEWQREKAISRGQAEALVRDALPPLVAVGQAVGGRRARRASRTR